jgi:hypothetical protein
MTRLRRAFVLGTTDRPSAGVTGVKPFLALILLGLALALPAGAALFRPGPIGGGGLPIPSYCLEGADSSHCLEGSSALYVIRAN